VNKPSSMLATAYLAGFFDGEGCVRVDKQGRMIVQVGNTSLEVLKKYRLYWGGSIAVQPVKRRRKAMWQWRIGGDAAQVFLEMILDFLVVKRHQAQAAIRYQETLDVRGRGRGCHTLPATKRLRKRLVARLAWFKRAS
jgi:LAGLIDADG-like domain